MIEFLTFNGPPVDTPWGVAESRELLAPGIWSITTASHGGIWLTPERLTAMPAELRALETFTRLPQWFEEDCDVAIVMLAFPDAFTPQAVSDAVSFVRVAYWTHGAAVRSWLHGTESGARALQRARGGRLDG